MSNATVTCKSDCDIYSSGGGMDGTVRIHKLFSFFILVLVFGFIGRTGSSADTPAFADESAVISAIRAAGLSTHRYVGKTAFTEGRLLFFAGLEGTGHHGIEDMFEKCRLFPGDHACIYESQLSMLLFYQQYPNPNVKVPDDARDGLFFGEKTDRTGTNVMRVFDELKKRKEEYAKHTHFFGLEINKNRNTGEMSYPNFNYGTKPLNYPDIVVLAVLMESLQIDFRIGVLIRNARDLMNSVMKRGFRGNTGPLTEARIMVDNAAALLAQMKMLDPRFIRCLEYEKMANMTTEQKGSLADFFSPSVFGFGFDQMLSVFSVAASTSQTDPLPIPRFVGKQPQDIEDYRSFVGAHITELEEIMNSIKELCKIAEKSQSH
jgi:hypothetical protein